MKRFSWIIFLGVFLAMMVSPAFATNYYIKLSGDSEAESGDAFKIWSNDENSLVNNNDTSHDFSALNAVLASGDTISFDSKVFRISSDVSLDIHSRDIKIIGNGATIDGQKTVANGQTREAAFIQISSDVAELTGVRIEGLTFKNISRSVSAHGTGGGAIAVTNSADNVTIYDCVFESNEIHFNIASYHYEYIGGAAIFAKDVAGLTIESCDFKQNFVSGDAGDGGAENGNTAKTTFGGAAIYVYAASKDTTVKIVSSDFKENTLGYFQDGKSGSGGAIAGVIDANNASIKNTKTAVWLSLDVSATNFENNKAGHMGGAIYVLADIDADTKNHASVDLTVKDSIFTGNHVGEHAANSGARGGAIMARLWNGLVNVNIENTEFKNNTASSDQLSGTQTGSTGGAVGLETGPGGQITANINGSNFDSNRSHFGGAIGSWGSSGSVDLVVQNSTFVNNSIINSGDNKAPYNSLFPVGGAIASRAQKMPNSISGLQTEAPGRAYTTIINSTFYSNDSYYGGAVANIVSDDKTIVSTDIIHSTFVNNTVSGASEDNGVDVFSVMTGTKDQTSSDIRVYDTIFYNSKGKYAIGAQSEDAVISLDKVAYVDGYLMSDDVIKSKDVKGYEAAISIDVDKFEAASKDVKKYKTLTIEVANEKTTIDLQYFPLGANDYEKLRKGGSSNDVAGNKIPSYSDTDFLGVSFDTKAPSLGAVQYKVFGISLDKTPDEDGVIDLGFAYKGQEVTESLRIDSEDPNFVIASVDWDVVDISTDEESKAASTDLSASFSDDGTLTVSADEAGVYTFTVTAKGKAGTDYEYVTAEQKFKLTVSADVITVVLTPTETGVKTVAGKAGDVLNSKDLVDITVSYNGTEVAVDSVELSWSSSSSDLVTVSSADGTFTTKATTFPTEGDYTLPIKVKATSGEVSADAEEVRAKVTVAAQNTLTLSVDTKDTIARIGETVSIVISGDGAKSWTLNGDDLPSYLTGTSAEGKYTIAGTVPETAEIAKYSYTLTASNDDPVNYAEASIDLTITVLDVAPVFGTATFNAPKGVAATQAIAATAGTSIVWSLSGQPTWVEITASSDEGVTLSATAPSTEKTNTTYTFQLVGANYSESTTTATEVSADVTVTVAGSISGDSNGYTEGTYTFPATRVTGTNAAGQPTATTTSVFKNGAGETLLSIDIMITVESAEIPGMEAYELSTPVSVDVSIDVKDENYTIYAYSFDVTGAEFLSVKESQTYTSKDLVSGHVQHNFTLVGTPEKAGSYDIVVTFNAYVSGDIPVLNAVDSIDATLNVIEEQYTGGDKEVVFSDDKAEYHISVPTTNANGEKVVTLTATPTREGETVNVQTVLARFSDEQLATTVINIGSGFTTLGDPSTLGTRSLDLTAASDLTDATLNLSGNEKVKSLTMGAGTGSITSVTLTGSVVENFSAKGSNLAKLDVAGSYVQNLEVSETKLSTLDTSNCEELQTLEANQCDTLETLTVRDCGKLETLRAQGNYHTRGGKAKGIKTANLARCKSLTDLDLSSNRLIMQHLEDLLAPLLTTVAMYDQYETTTAVKGRFSMRELFFGNIRDAENEEVQLTEDQAEDLARVTAVSGLDAAGTPIEATYNAATGEVVFAKTPATIKYAYDTKSGVNGGNIEAEISPASMEDADPSTPGEGSGSGGCEAFGAGMFSMMILLAGAFMKRR